MLDDLTKTFFDTFGIEPKCYCGNDYVFEAMLEDECTDGNREKCKTCKKVRKTYPQITDHILLKLVCLYNNFQNDVNSFFIPCDFTNIKNNILTILVKEINDKHKNRYFCNDVDKLKQQVHRLFEEG